VTEAEPARLFRVLGPLEVRCAGTPAPIPAAKPRTLLSYLLVRANHTVATDEVIEELWGGSPPASALANVRTYIAGLRRALRDGDGTLIAAHRNGYQLRLAGVELDLAAFRAAAARGRAALAAGQPAGAVDLLDRAHAMWRGRALEDVVAGPGLAARAAQLDEERLTVVEDAAEARLALGEPADVVPLLRQHLADQPLRERAYALLMTALYRCGDPAAALAAFAAARQSLAQHLGLEPARQLVALQQAVLTRDPGLDGPRPVRAVERPRDGYHALVRPRARPGPVAAPH
jgi:DNA-binding SARP family transcriptional activator